MTADTERFIGESGARIEVRYLDDQCAANGLREIDEVVSGLFHLETMTQRDAYITLDGLRVMLRAENRRPGGLTLSIWCEPDGATREGER